MKLGDFEVHLISDGRFWLDGGAMFGVVPKPLWQRKSTPDDLNRIPLGLNCLLIQTGQRNILVDTGCGHKYSEKEIRIYGIEHDTDILAELRRFGLAADDIDTVINTHLHFDHCGGNTRLQGDEVVATFPRAKYWVREQELKDATHPNERTQATYFAHNWAPIQQRGQLEVVTADRQVVPGVEVIRTPGHTLGHQSVKVSSGGQTLFFIADLCPTTAHIPLPWIMGYDLHPMTTLQTRHEIYRQAVEEEWLIVFEHDPETPSGHLQLKDGKYILHPHLWRD